MSLPRCLLALAFLPCLLSISSQASPLYSVTLLPGADFAPADMNNAGQLVGRRFTGSGYVAVTYANGIQTDLVLQGAAESYASAINDAGTVTGTFLAPSDQVYGFVYQGGSMRALGAGTASFAINAQGNVVGTIQTANGSTGFVDREGTLTELGNLGTGTIGQALGINDRGQIVGTSTVTSAAENAPTHPFLYSDGALQDLGTLAQGMSNGAVAINNAGQVAGYADGADGTVHAFLYGGGILQDLGGFGSTLLNVDDLNEHGTLVGTAITVADRSVPFMNLGGALVDLNTLIDPALGWTLFNAFAINDLGQIAGYGCNGTTCGLVRLDVTDAVPEPSPPFLLLSGILALATLTPRGVRHLHSATDRCPLRVPGSVRLFLMRRLTHLRHVLLRLALLPALFAPLLVQAHPVYTATMLPQNFGALDINNRSTTDQQPGTDGRHGRC